METFLVGGQVRDEIMGVRSNDLDFVVLTRDFDEMKTQLLLGGFKIFLETPAFLTIRARFPAGHEHAGQTADFVMARKDVGFTDGRHPDRVVPGTLLDDLARRDFTMNAIAKDNCGVFHDPFGGQADIQARTIRAVGNADDRIQEDALRILRAIRFSVTKDFWIEPELKAAIHNNSALLNNVSVERVREELQKMFMHDTMKSLDMMQAFPIVRGIVFSEMPIRLKPTLEQ